MGWCVPIPAMGTVCAGMGAGWDFLTHRLPVLNLVPTPPADHISTSAQQSITEIVPAPIQQVTTPTEPCTPPV